MKCYVVAILRIRDNAVQSRMFKEPKLSLTKAVETFRIAEISIRLMLDTIDNDTLLNCMNAWGQLV